MPYHSNNRNNYPWTRPVGNSLNLSDQIPPAPSITYSAVKKRSYSPDKFSGTHPPAPCLSEKKHFFGPVTKLCDSWGIVDSDIYFSFGACTKGIPKLNDFVSVDAYQSSSGTYKWKASKVIMAQFNGRDYVSLKSMPISYSEKRILSTKSRERSTERGRDRRYDENDRKRFKRDDRDDKFREHDKDIHRDREKYKNHEKSPVRRSRSPMKRKMSTKYSVKVPNEPSILKSADIMTLKRRYPAMHIPSDFCSSTLHWVDTLPLTGPYTLDKPCNFHIMSKDCEAPTKNDEIYNSLDVDYSFSAKVMLMAVPDFEEIYKRTTPLAEDLLKEEDKYTHLSRLIQFLVGSRGKGEPLAIGGPWSPSLDGENPRKYPETLIRTAIRTCRALTGIDLSSCSRWYRFMDVFYHRCESVHKGKNMPARIETVVFFLPEVWNCMPSCLDWDTSIKSQYKILLDEKLNPKHTRESSAPPDVSNEAADDSDKEEDLVVIDKCEEKVEPTHYSELDSQNMKVNELRQELEARSLPTRGLRPHLVQRLELALRKEKDAEAESALDSNFLVKFIKEHNELKDIQVEGDLKVVDEVKEIMWEKEDKKGNQSDMNKDDVEVDQSHYFNQTETLVPDKEILKRKYVLPATPHIIVHPSRTAKSGKFECYMSSIASLLDYRSNENKEHSFELYLFAELFHEMLQRDFGYNIYKSVCRLPEKTKDEKNDKEIKKNGKDGKPDSSDKLEAAEVSTKEENFDSSLKSDKINEEAKKKEKIKLMTKDRFLLLSFLFFDRSKCGFMYDKDLETLILSLGLHLTRHQVKKLVYKACSTKDALFYRRITDKPENVEANQTTTDIDDVILGNHKYLPIFEEGADSKAPESTVRVVNVGGSFVDVENVTASLKKSEIVRIETEKQLLKCKHEIETLKETIKELTDKEKRSYDDSKLYRDKLSGCYKAKNTLKGQTRSYYKALMTIKETIAQIEDKDREREVHKKSKEKEKGKEKLAERATSEKTEVPEVNQVEFKEIDSIEEQSDVGGQIKEVENVNNRDDTN